ncbi:DUF7096 domain-containing protein [Natronococcus occultus]|uniref:Uncharacterized protein n=1 Tax=Natronococcus occultus SP4 TaxID=694430 RepID=L0K289_9EURY|nr:hypothetical protein [Natronococcus occultus]AGB38218.1 hypothetical protein Natoc_2443 [Natronococcus occultus SP4]
MKRAMAVLLAGLLVLSLPAVAVSATDSSETDETALETDEPSQPFVETNGTTNRLDPGADPRSERTEHGDDLGTTLMSADDELRVDYEQEAIVRNGFENASSGDREEMVQLGYERLQERTDVLEERERAAVREHAADDRSTTRLLQTFSRNYHESSVIASALDELVGYADRVPEYSLSIRDDKSVLEMYRTDVRSQLDATSDRGESDRTHLAVRTAETGYSLSVLDRNYVREATRFDSRNASQPDQFNDITDAHGTAQELYPWVFEADHETHSSMAESRTVQLYRIQAIHDQGQLTAYLDGGTGTVHRELQTLDHEQLPPIDDDRWTEDGLELSITETAANGPAEVSVADADTGDPVAATVSIEGAFAGETGSSGSLWVLPPDGEFDLRADADGDSVAGTVSDTDS